MASGARVRSQGNVGLWCVGSRNHGSNGYRGEPARHRRPANGLVHLPTIWLLAYNIASEMKVDVPVPSKIPHCDPSFGKSPRTPDF